MDLLSVKKSCRVVLYFLIAGYHSYSQPSADTTINKSIGSLDSCYYTLIPNYVEGINVNKLTRKGIDAMLNSLDPHTYYLSKEEADEFRLNLTGKFGGTGIVLRNVDDETVISDVIDGFPGDRAGLQPGDIILSIDGIRLKGKSIDDVFPLLRGLPDTKVTVSIKRAGESAAFSKTMTREQITLTSVPYYGMINDKVGYIKLTQVTKNCSEDVRKALLALKTNAGLESLVLDLRDNTGGYLLEAVRMANFFLPQGSRIVQQKGRTSDTVYYADSLPIDISLRMAVLTNEETASAAEILTGALQDNDRSVIIGKKTFGKGLVGEIFNLPGGAQMVITTSHYYTPSGRCIQLKEYSGGKGGALTPDSLKKNFKTLHGRNVKDNEGIIPDITLTAEARAPYLNSLIDSHHIFRFASQYRAGHPVLASPKKFSLTEEEYTDFLNSLRGKIIVYKTATGDKLDELKKIAAKEGYGKIIEPLVMKMSNEMALEQQKDKTRYKAAIKDMLEQEIVSRYYRARGRIESGLRNDAWIKKTVEVLGDVGSYNKILALK
jgi:carboxyl-terminal processing protease